MTLDAELPEAGHAPIGGLEFVMGFASNEIQTLVPIELTLDPKEPTSIILPAGDWTATAVVHTLSDVVDADGRGERIARASESCSHDFSLAWNDRAELVAVFRLREDCAVKDDIEP